LTRSSNFEFNFLKEDLMVKRASLRIFMAPDNHRHRCQIQEMTMKTLIIASALAAVLVSPALADAGTGSKHSGAAAHAHVARGAYNAFARHNSFGGTISDRQRPAGSGYYAPRATVRPMESWDPYGMRWD
jgi:hypothetical protein